MTTVVVTIVRVTIEDRLDNGINVWSENLPGLILSGSDRERVTAMIVPAIKALLERHGLSVLSVTPTKYKPIEEVLKEPSPRKIDMKVAHHEQSYRVEFEDAA